MSGTTYPTLIKVLDYFPYRKSIYVTSTTGGSHSKTSYHYRKEAIDVGSKSQAMKDSLAAWLYNFSGHETELLHSRAGGRSGWYVKNGKRVSGSFYGHTLVMAHVNHVHLAAKDQATANALLTMARQWAAGHNGAKPSLKQGTSGALVTTLQKKLTAKGFKVAADGHFGPGTKAAVVKFQKAKKLPADGVVGARTWAALG